MHNKSLRIDYIEIYTPMAKALAYWHVQALGFTPAAKMNAETGAATVASYVLKSNDIQLVLTSAYPTAQGPAAREVESYISQQYCGVKRIALHTDDVKASFHDSVANGAIPLRVPAVTEDAHGWVEEAAVKLYDNSEITFVNRSAYNGAFKPGYQPDSAAWQTEGQWLQAVDHVAAEVRINEAGYWTNYLTAVIGSAMVQNIGRSEDNRTGMILNINQTGDRQLTFVIAEPETCLRPSKVQDNINKFGPGVHHLAFSTEDLQQTVDALSAKGVDFVRFPAAYYELLRNDADFKTIDIDALEEKGIIIDKEGDAFLLQKFIKPISDRPFFIYELVQRVNGYSGFALRNINVLKKAEEIEILQTR
ncbi:VOC family protein [Chitinophaga solisilvae]|uniref:VOC family protein n=1 Tax=Chitinophaga solisilvae TaxID=1233460 RepID=UPI00136E3165|nr:VOC family protein [Chitinophaga solisilvae]